MDVFWAAFPVALFIASGYCARAGRLGSSVVFVLLGAVALELYAEWRIMEARSRA
jgi:hypothetical protein